MVKRKRKMNERDMCGAVLDSLMDNFDDDLDASIRVLAACVWSVKLGIDMRESGGSFDDYCMGLAKILNTLDAEALQ